MVRHSETSGDTQVRQNFEDKKTCFGDIFLYFCVGCLTARFGKHYCVFCYSFCYQMMRQRPSSVKLSAPCCVVCNWSALLEEQKCRLDVDWRSCNVKPAPGKYPRSILLPMTWCQSRRVYTSWAVHKTGCRLHLVGLHPGFSFEVSPFHSLPESARIPRAVFTLRIPCNFVDPKCPQCYCYTPHPLVEQLAACFGLQKA